MLFLIVAYGVIWLGTIGYCISLAMMVNHIKSDLKSLQEKLKK
jgi:CcmD family protein